MPNTIYLDYNATTPLDPAVQAAMLPFLGEVWGNPSSVHHVGRKARALLDDARDRAAKFLGAKPSEIIFTSGGTESNNLAVLGTARLLKSKGKHVITSAIEHHAVLHCFDYLEKKEGFTVTRLPVDSIGPCFARRFEAARFAKTLSWYPSWPQIMKLGRFSRWLNWARCAVSGASFFTRMLSNRLGKSRLKPLGSSMRT